MSGLNLLFQLAISVTLITGSIDKSNVAGIVIGVHLSVVSILVYTLEQYGKKVGK